MHQPDFAAGNLLVGGFLAAVVVSSAFDGGKEKNAKEDKD